MKILISPYCRPLQSGGKNPKNFPYWADVVGILVKEGCDVYQVGIGEEAKLPGIAGTIWGMNLKDLKKEVLECSSWGSVDNFFHHFAYYAGKPGVVVMGMQDPYAFGHPGNNNIVKDSRFTRDNIWSFWDESFPNDDCWPTASEIATSIIKQAKSNEIHSAIRR